MEHLKKNIEYWKKNSQNLVKYAAHLELKNKDLKKQIETQKKEIARLIRRREIDTCEWRETEEGYLDCYDILREEEEQFCPRCGGKVKILTLADQNQRAYDWYIDSEIDWRKEQAAGA